MVKIVLKGKCPHCSETDGYYIVFIERVTQSNTFSGEAFETDYKVISGGRIKRCLVCDKALRCD